MKSQKCRSFSGARIVPGMQSFMVALTQMVGRTRRAFGRTVATAKHEGGNAVVYRIRGQRLRPIKPIQAPLPPWYRTVALQNYVSLLVEGLVCRSRTALHRVFHLSHPHLGLAL